MKWTTADSINSSHANDILWDIHTMRDLGINLFKSFKPGADKRFIEPGMNKS